MKTAMEAVQRSGDERVDQPRREWTLRSIFKLVLACGLLSLVYFLASWIPVERDAATGNLVSGFLMFWVLGGVFTVALLALTDRRA